MPPPSPGVVSPGNPEEKQDTESRIHNKTSYSAPRFCRKVQWPAFSIQELSNDELDAPSLVNEVEEELKDITLDFDNNDSPSDIISQDEVEASTLDVDNMFDDFDDFNE